MREVLFEGPLDRHMHIITKTGMRFEM